LLILFRDDKARRTPGRGRSFANDIQLFQPFQFTFGNVLGFDKAYYSRAWRQKSIPDVLEVPYNGGDPVGVLIIPIGRSKRSFAAVPGQGCLFEIYNEAQ
jgi:hypothetical protein